MGKMAEWRIQNLDQRIVVNPKFQAPNYKQISIFQIQNKIIPFEAWCLDIVCSLEFLLKDFGLMISGFYTKYYIPYTKY